jgi:DNA modification methylase
MTKNENEELERPHPKNTLNDMGGNRFLYFTKSVLTTAYPAVYSHELRKQHGANKPPQLMAQLIEFFTKAGMSVLAKSTFFLHSQKPIIAHIKRS